MTHIAIIGLGKMGGNMARRLVRGGIHPLVMDQDAALTESLAAEIGCASATSLHAAIAHLGPRTAGPRIVWLMLPSGGITEGAFQEAVALLQPGDLLVDGANSMYKDAQRRAAVAAQHGLLFADVGVSGGVHGLANGYCLMAGGTDAAIALLKPVLQALAPAPDGQSESARGNTGWLHAGPVGAGHFVKMVHNGIEYGMMQAFGEGFAMLDAKKEFDIDTAAVAHLWRHGSVVRSWLLDLTAKALTEDPSLATVQPHVADSGEGRWTAQEAVDLAVPTPVMSLALMMRFASRGEGDFSAKLLAKMRQGFGGHAVKEAK
jgi:6-phosphogluconate dehydrogenase